MRNTETCLTCGHRAKLPFREIVDLRLPFWPPRATGQWPLHGWRNGFLTSEWRRGYLSTLPPRPGTTAYGTARSSQIAVCCLKITFPRPNS